MFNLISKFAHKAEIRESKDEMLVGEIVRVMSRQGYPSIAFTADSGRQRIQFRAVDNPVLYSVHIILDRKTGDGMVTSAILGSKATLTITAEVKNRLSDPDDLVKMYRTDLANLFKLPVIGGIKLNHEMNSIYATQTKIIEIDNYVLKGDEGTQSLGELLRQCIEELAAKLEPYKKA